MVDLRAVYQIRTHMTRIRLSIEIFAYSAYEVETREDYVIKLTVEILISACYRIAITLQWSLLNSNGKDLIGWLWYTSSGYSSLSYNV